MGRWPPFLYSQSCSHFTARGVVSSWILYEQSHNYIIIKMLREVCDKTVVLGKQHGGIFGVALLPNWGSIFSAHQLCKLNM